VPATRRQPLEEGGARELFVEMEGLRIELRGKRLDRGRVQLQRARAEALADREILEVAPSGNRIHASPR
jgi:hypothetical protein